jgi:hypothetical protein
MASSPTATNDGTGIRTDETPSAPVSSSSTVAARIHHHQGVAPQPDLPEPPSEMVGLLMRPMPQDIGTAVIQHGPVSEPRQALPAVTFTLPGNPPRTVVAHPSAALTEVLSDTQHNRVAGLLAVPSNLWHGGADPNVVGSHVELRYSVDDPQATPGGTPPRVHISLLVDLGSGPDARPSIVLMTLGANDDVVLPMASRRHFRSRDTVLQALVQSGARDALQEAALAADERVHFDSHGTHGTMLVSYHFMQPREDGNGARLVSARVELRRNALLGSYIVAAVSAQATDMQPLALRPECAAWLAGADPSPHLPEHVIALIGEAMQRYERGQALPEGVRLEPDAHGHRLILQGPVADPNGNLQAWNLRVSFVPHGQEHVAAAVTRYRPPTHQGHVDIFLRESTDDWTNPHLRGGGTETSVGSSLRSGGLSLGQGSTASVRTRSPDHDGDGDRRVRRRTEDGLTASEIRQQQQQLEALIQLEETHFGDDAAPAPAAGGGLYMTEADYRQRYNLPLTTPVCPPIAASVGLNRLVPFDVMRQYNPQAGTVGSTADQMQALLTGYGRVNVVRNPRPLEQMRGANATYVAAQLQRQLTSNGHTAAVLVYRLDSQPGDSETTVRGHHVTVFQDDQGQWRLHDGHQRGREAVRMTWDQIVAYTFGANTQGASELEVLSFVRPEPPEGSASVPATGTALGADASGDNSSSSSTGSLSDTVLESGAGQLTLSDEFSSSSRSPWRTFLIRMGLTAQHLPVVRGRTINWRRVAEDVVNVCNGEQRMRSPGAVMCAGVALPPGWSTANAPFANNIFDVQLTVDGDTVTDIALSSARPRPVPVVLPDTLSRTGGVSLRDQSRILAALEQQFPALYAVLPRRGATGGQVDWQRTLSRLMLACVGAAAHQVQTDSTGRPIVEITDLEFEGVPITVLLRFDDLARGEVFDLRIYDPLGLQPTFAWN